MNRKLLNGLLVVALAAGGVGTFTSCKDDNFHNEVLKDQLDLSQQIDAIRQVTDSEFQTKLLAWLQANYPHITKSDVQQWMNEWTSEQGQADLNTYPDVVKKVATLVTYYNDLKNKYDNLVAGNYTEGSDGAKIANAMYEWLIQNKFPNEAWYKQIWENQNNIAALEAKLPEIAQYFQDLINSQVTSIEINQTTNPVFGSINLPLGINSSVLATYQYNGETMSFPADISVSSLAKINWSPEQYAALLNAFETIVNLSASSSKEVTQWSFTAPESPTSGNMGSVFATLNPVGNDFSGVKLSIVNAKGETIIDGLKATPYDGDLYFGISRAESNVPVYEIPVNAVLGHEAPLAFRLGDKDGLKEAVKDLVKNKSFSSIASLGHKMYDYMKDVLPAYALQVSWGNEDLDLGSDDAATRAENTKKVLSKYELAATVITPLSYTEPLSDLIDTDRRIPTIDPITEYLHKINNKLNFRIETDLKINEFKITLDYTGSGVIKAQVIGTEEGVNKGQVIGEAELPYGSKGPQKPEAGDPDYDQKLEAYNQSLNAFIDELLADMQDQVDGAINDYMGDLKNQLDDVLGQVNKVNAKLDDIQNYIDRLEGSKKVQYAQKVVDKLNAVITKVNDFLSDPNKYLQVLMAYDAGDGAHHASESAAAAVPVDATNATERDYVALYIASYTGDVVVPSFKKYVAITKVMGNDNADLAALNEKAGLNKVLEGSELSIPMMVKGLAGVGVVQITYVSLDYRGNLSAQNYYFNFK